MAEQTGTWNVGKQVDLEMVGKGRTKLVDLEMVGKGWTKQVDLEMVGKGRTRLSHGTTSNSWAWQVHLGSEVWQDANPMWTEPLFRALRDGVRTIRLPHKYQNKSGEYVESAYTIDCRNATRVTQQNLSSGKRRMSRAVYMIMPQDYTLPDPPPTEPPADPAGPAPADL